MVLSLVRAAFRCCASGLAFVLSLPVLAGQFHPVLFVLLAILVWTPAAVVVVVVGLAVASVLVPLIICDTIVRLMIFGFGYSWVAAKFVSRMVFGDVIGADSADPSTRPLRMHGLHGIHTSAYRRQDSAMNQHGIRHVIEQFANYRLGSAGTYNDEDDACADGALEMPYRSYSPTALSPTSRRSSRSLHDNIPPFRDRNSGLRHRPVFIPSQEFDQRELRPRRSSSVHTLEEFQVEVLGVPPRGGNYHPKPDTASSTPGTSTPTVARMVAMSPWDSGRPGSRSISPTSVRAGNVTPTHGQLNWSSSSLLSGSSRVSAGHHRASSSTTSLASVHEIDKISKIDPEELEELEEAIENVVEEPMLGWA